MRLVGKRIVMAIAEGYHEHEFWFPYYRFREEGATVVVAGPAVGVVLGEGRNGRDGLPAKILTSIAQETLEPRRDALYLPGGIWSPLELRAHEAMINLVRSSMRAGEIVAAICHAPWILVSAGVLVGRRISCARDMRVDAINAGATVVDEPCVSDGNLITAEYYAYLPEHLRAVITALEAK